MKFRTMMCATLSAGALALGCGDAETASLLGGGGPSGPGAGATPTGDSGMGAPGDDGGEAAGACAGRAYVGFAGTDLGATRKVGAIGENRLRLKPYDLLANEYARVIGTTPAGLAGSADTFGAAPDRWYAEPGTSAVTLRTAYELAFDGCLTYTAKIPAYATMPDATTGPAECATMARKFWSRTPGTSEIAACVDVVSSGAKTEPVASRRWAYGCAAVLSSAGFLTF